MLNDALIAEAKALVAAYEADDTEQATAHYKNLSSISEQNLFNEIGKLTRDLHETLNNFHLDNRLTSLAAHDIPDAKDRLEYVVQTTADAANKTMDAVEKGIAIASHMQSDSDRLDNEWQKVHDKSVNGADFRTLCADTQVHMTEMSANSKELNALLHEALLAQDFQDLTGQVINRVIQLVQDVESGLVETIKMFGGSQEYEEEVAKERTLEEGSTGPTIKPKELDEVVSNQDDVDDLLSSLGF
ncbi:MAG: protein phosphatase CheZ [Gammaproteobacteria bacterium]|jgi:chemotaxis protein CheZ